MITRSARVWARSSCQEERHLDQWVSCAPLMPSAETVTPRPGFRYYVADVPRHGAAEGQRQAAVAADDLPAAASGGNFASVERQGLFGQDGFGEDGICLSLLLPSLALMVTLLPLALAMMPPKGKSSETLRLLTVCHEPS